MVPLPRPTVEEAELSSSQRRRESDDVSDTIVAPSPGVLEASYRSQNIAPPCVEESALRLRFMIGTMAPRVMERPGAAWRWPPRRGTGAAVQ